ncbi:winged helix-turn-helix domain-containing protein [Methanoplanus limicola]|uniref:Regulatory protein MarR n=1 Tax=Methanoplanus limicola DSM 2279 TaxID=937775 RepID=H1Z2N5_9EURY|nr:winged helix-turn-helix domain-containing protein [Methanoplanus limicola]EHQ36438.1 regulatory protein MarR [Methanoplanus limicola DSM 2279]
MDKQLSLNEVQAINWVNTLNRKQQKIINLLSTGEMTQSQIAKRIGVTRQYVNQLVKKLEKYNLISKSDKTPSGYNIWYKITGHLKKQIEKKTPDAKVTACRVHNVRLKYSYEISGNLSKDRRTKYLSSWQMRGGDRHKYCLTSRSGLNITIDVHPKTIVAYPDANSQVYAESIEEAETIIKTSIHEAVLSFLQKQRSFGTDIEIDTPQHTGKQITNTHYGFEFSKNAPIAQPQTILEGFFIDGSPEANGKPGMWEVETLDPARATAMDRGLERILQLGNSDPYLNNISAVLQPIYNQLTEIKENQTTDSSLINHLTNLSKIVGAILKKQTELEARFLTLSVPDSNFDRLYKFT